MDSFDTLMQQLALQSQMMMERDRERVPTPPSPAPAAELPSEDAEDDHARMLDEGCPNG